ncbi:adenosylcobinamide-GDP ribazoletransferase [Lederbergia citrea]|uniref:adenosylcobinamide-GDP ribazoletransferase n=1 Tax=Lederbergia citrea TaxID=2833581 RepID=UPI001BC8CF42|nr:adenosylcobinamide-GDP ribazoletransferase [Lederbergia citrea]MBS4178020.1 adenosylcobinamide-GDP ribazoletransferase [Lederbergia citrea]MBS4204687.1 adenosylcobinamide-GDP ribazoletransferase [Lederbergia citrea]
MITIRAFLINLQFFTSIPVKLQLPMDKVHMKRAIGLFPLLGLFQGLLYTCLVYSINEWTPFSLLTAAFFLWLGTIVITGGLHLDGWIDMSDAYFSYQDREKRLEIMKDPRTGAFGVISVLVLLAARFFFIYEIMIRLSPGTYWLLVFIPFFGKMVMGLNLVFIQPVKKEGMAYFFHQNSNKSVVWAYGVQILIVFLAFILFANGTVYGVLLLLLSSILVFFFLKRKVLKWFGGITGDVLGASVEGTEIFLWMTIWLFHYFGMG